ncbi:ankyrin repeat domain-containing protein [Ramlibacter sp. 2FC]|uniref:ankyrin repeat domain-containing protein n=1 Tax=Ramlibacter sp. 2FC TaxID=2502188 RepID=UPI0010F81733|nr:ankyrin repeat domain-containing protein [Ramlibacter sp. 2FC]
MPSKLTLHAAVVKGDVEAVKALIAARVDINLQDESGRTALHHAVFAPSDVAGRETVIELLLTAGARTDIKDHHGRTALGKARIRPIPIEQESKTLLRAWQVFELTLPLASAPSRHVIGRTLDGEGRVTSPVVNWDWAHVTATTRSGRVYQLKGEPGYDEDAFYVFEGWLKAHKLDGATARPVTTEIWDNIEAARSACLMKIRIEDYPQLKFLCWNRHTDGESALMDGWEAFALYERNWKWVEEDKLTPAERELIETLTREYGGGVLDKEKGIRWQKEAEARKRLAALGGATPDMQAIPRRQHPMEHRHLDTREYTLPAVDSIMERGTRFPDWRILCRDAIADPELLGKIESIAKARSDPADDENFSRPVYQRWLRWCKKQRKGSLE